MDSALSAWIISARIYDEGLKAGRLEILQSKKNFCFSKVDIADRPDVKAVFEKQEFGPIVQSGCQGRRQVLTGESGPLHKEQSHGIRESA